MRVSACLVLVAALMATGCDKQSAPTEQANAASANNADAATSPTAGIAGNIDRTHMGSPAPTLRFDGPDGKPTTLAAFGGKPVLLNLWATWCAPCVKELPTLDALAVREAGKIQVVTLSQDMDPAKVAPFFAERQFKALKAYTDPKMAWATTLGANLPTTILFDSAGKEVWRTTGDLDWTGPVATQALAELS
jgi:thiol-disulfide isomerase/thioredoxin